MITLRVKDIDIARDQITARNGKGAKDRGTVLPKSLVPALQVQIDQGRQNRPQYGDGYSGRLDHNGAPCCGTSDP